MQLHQALRVRLIMVDVTEDLWTPPRATNHRRPPLDKLNFPGPTCNAAKIMPLTFLSARFDFSCCHVTNLHIMVCLIALKSSGSWRICSPEQISVLLWMTCSGNNNIQFVDSGVNDGADFRGRRTFSLH